MPGHTNEKVTYKVYGTNESYEGKVVEVGGFIYSTESGALEGVHFDNNCLPYKMVLKLMLLKTLIH